MLMKRIGLSIGKFLIVIGTILIAASLFMGYVTMESVEILGNKEIESISGVDIITGDNGDMNDLSFLHWVPLLALLSSIVALIMTKIPIFSGILIKRKKYNAIIAIFMGVSVALSVVFLTIGAGTELYIGTSKEIIKGLLESGMVDMKPGIGAAISLIGGIIGLVGALILTKEGR
jgi:hypothetical protein